MKISKRSFPDALLPYAQIIPKEDWIDGDQCRICFIPFQPHHLRIRLCPNTMHAYHTKCCVSQSDPGQVCHSCPSCRVNIGGEQVNVLSPQRDYWEYTPNLDDDTLLLLQDPEPIFNNSLIWQDMSSYFSRNAHQTTPANIIAKPAVFSFAKPIAAPNTNQKPSPPTQPPPPPSPYPLAPTPPVTPKAKGKPKGKPRGNSKPAAAAVIVEETNSSNLEDLRLSELRAAYQNSERTNPNSVEFYRCKALYIFHYWSTSPSIYLFE